MSGIRGRRLVGLYGLGRPAQQRAVRRLCAWRVHCELETYFCVDIDDDIIASVRHLDDLRRGGSVEVSVEGEQISRCLTRLPVCQGWNDLAGFLRRN